MTLRGKKIGELLIDKGLIDQLQLERALAYQKRLGIKIGDALVEIRAISESQLASTVAEELDLQVVNPATIVVGDDVKRAIPKSLAMEHKFMPLKLEDLGRRKILHIAMSDPLDFKATEAISYKLNLESKVFVCTQSHLKDAYKIHYGRDGQVVSALEDVPSIELRPTSGPLQIMSGGQERTLGDNSSSRPFAPPSPPPPRQAEPSESRAPSVQDPNAWAMEEEFGSPPPALGDQIEPTPLPARRRETGSNRISSPLGIGERPKTGVKANDPSMQLNALLRVLLKKGLISKEEFLAELRYLTEKKDK